MKTKTFNLKLLLIFLVALAGERAFGQINFSSPVSFGLPGNTDLVSYGEFTGDKLTDIIAISVDINNDPLLFTYKLLVFPQSKRGALQIDPIVYPFKGTPETMIVSDINNDGYMDIIIGLYQKVLIIFQKKKGVLSEPVEYVVNGKSVDALASGDVNHDGYTDIAIAYWQSDIMEVLFGSKSGKLELIQYPGFGRGYDHISICKLGKDKKNSILKLCGQGSSEFIQYKINADRTLDTMIYLTPLHPGTYEGMCTAKMYSKIENSIFVSYGGNKPYSRVCAWKNFQSDTADKLFSVIDMPSVMCSGDLDNDGYEEVIILHEAFNSVSILSRDTIKIFYVPCNSKALVNSLVVADVNNDKKLDIITANNRTGIQVLLNTTIKTKKLSN